MTDLIRNGNNYGIVGNSANYLALKLLNEQKQKPYRNYLRKENPEAYAEFLKFEKDFSEYSEE